MSGTLLAYGDKVIGATASSHMWKEFASHSGTSAVDISELLDKANEIGIIVRATNADFVSTPFTVFPVVYLKSMTSAGVVVVGDTRTGQPANNISARIVIRIVGSSGRSVEVSSCYNQGTSSTPYMNIYWR